MIGNAVLCRAASNRVSIHKLRAHIGVTGNGHADIIAKAAAEMEADGEGSDARNI